MEYWGSVVNAASRAHLAAWAGPQTDMANPALRVTEGIIGVVYCALASRWYEPTGPGLSDDREGFRHLGGEPVRRYKYSNAVP